jgi:hypothetical protein
MKIFISLRKTYCRNPFDIIFQSRFSIDFILFTLMFEMGLRFCAGKPCIKRNFKQGYPYFLEMITGSISMYI